MEIHCILWVIPQLIILVKHTINLVEKGPRTLLRISWVFKNPPLSYSAYLFVLSLLCKNKGTWNLTKHAWGVVFNNCLLLMIRCELNGKVVRGQSWNGKEAQFKGPKVGVFKPFRRWVSVCLVFSAWRISIFDINKGAFFGFPSLLRFPVLQCWSIPANVEFLQCFQSNTSKRRLMENVFRAYSFLLEGDYILFYRQLLASTLFSFACLLWSKHRNLNFQTCSEAELRDTEVNHSFLRLTFCIILHAGL